jgi:hypothetical protein
MSLGYIVNTAGIPDVRIEGPSIRASTGGDKCASYDREMNIELSTLTLK